MKKHQSTWSVLAGLAALLLLLACGGDADAPTRGQETGAAPPQAESAIATEPNEAVPAKDGHDHHRNERPLPSFGGRTLDGKALRIGDLVGKRSLIVFFNPDAEGAAAVGEAVAKVSKQTAEHNFQLAGVAIGSTRSSAVSFAKLHGLDFPIIDDSAGAITQQLNLRAPLMILGVDSELYISFVMGGFPVDVPDAPTVIADMIRERMRLPLSTTETSAGEVSRGPMAPLFRAERMEGGEPFKLAEVLGKPVVLIFFLHTCPHCHAALEFFKGALEGIEDEKRPLLVGVSLQNRPSAVKSAMREAGLDYFPILFDTKEEVAQAYGVFGGVPDIFVIDRGGRIVRHIQGWRDDRDPALMRMVLAREAGVRVPMLLNKKGYTGNDVCGVCHEAEQSAWEFTAHSSAFATLVTHGADKKDDCVSCHVVGFGKAGGYDFDEQPEHLENVGCESCHGRGGPHLSPDFVKEQDGYEAVCKTCHNPTHSLGFDYATFHPKVSHTGILAMTPAQREDLVKGHGGPRELLASPAAYVGSDACQSCHESEHATWQAGPHGKALASLEKEGKTDDPECLRCHTTALGRKGGFVVEAGAAAQPDLARVGCESCHGPGGDHLVENGSKQGYIVSLGDKCDSCVILKICGSCHDEANDPGFTFEVEAKIERQRHGTIEPGTGRKLSELPDSPSHTAADLARAFELLGKPG